MCRVEHSHVPELGGQEGARAVDEWVQGPWGLLCVEALAKAGIGAANTCLFYSKIPGAEHPCGLCCKPLLLCFQLHKPGFYSPFAEPLAMAELLLTQQASGAKHLRGCSLFHLSW